MQYKFFLLIIFFSTVFLIDGFAQAPVQNEPKTISGGVLNGKALNLVKPAYPKEAKDANADGAVVIQITIDVQGNVVAAEAVSGQPLLREAAVQAALSSKFPPTALQGQPVKVKGVIVYNFVLAMPFMRIGFELALAQKNPAPEDFPLASLSGTLPRYWTEELADLKKLESFTMKKPVEEEKPEKEKPAEKEKLEKDEAKYNIGAVENVNRGTVLKAPPLTAANFSISGSRSSSGVTLNNKIPEAVETLKNVQTKLDSRLSPNQRILWFFRVGRVLGSIKAEIDSADRRKENLADLDRLLTNVPSGVSETAVEKLREVSEFSQKTGFDAKTKDKLLVRLNELRFLRAE